LVLSDGHGAEVLLLSVGVVGLLEVGVEEVEVLVFLDLNFGVLDSFEGSRKFVLVKRSEVVSCNLISRGNEKSAIIGEALRNLHVGNSVVAVASVCSTL
jgi:hypothetical protein